MKKILHVTKKFEDKKHFGGIEIFIKNLTSGIKNYKHNFLYCNNKKTNKKHFVFKEDFNIFSCPFSFKALQNFRSVTKNFDIIHYHSPWPFMDILSFFSLCKKEIVTYHADPYFTKMPILRYLYYPLFFIFLIKIDTIIVTSKKYFLSSPILKFFKKKVVIIHIGIKSKNVKTKKNLLKKYNVKNKYVLYLGGLRDYKGLDVIINSLKYLNTKIVIAGDGKNRDFVKRFSKKYKNLIFIKTVDDRLKNTLLKNCELLILPSVNRNEAFGIVLLEAAKYQKPLITTEIQTATSYINLNNKTGFVIKPKEPLELAKSINKLLKSSHLRSKFGKNNFLRFKKLFNYQTMIKKYLLAYENL